MTLLSIFGITNNALLAVTAALTGVALVALAMWIAGLISPRSFNPQKASHTNAASPHAANPWPNSTWATISSPSCF